jgi:arylformamidase
MECTDHVSRVVLLSYPYDPSDPLPPAIPPGSVAPFMTLEHDGARTFHVKLVNHSGTHADAPAHVIDTGCRIAEFDAADFIYRNPVVIDVPAGDGEGVGPDALSPHADAIRDADLVLLRFGYGAVRAGEPKRYATRCPGLTVAGAAYLRATCVNMRALGMDVPSLACIARLEETMPAHHELLRGTGRRFLVLEDLRLEPADLRGLHSVLVAPWLIAGVDSAPCSVYGFCQD